MAQMVFVRNANGGAQVTDEKGRQVVLVHQANGGLAIHGDRDLLRDLSSMKRLDGSVDEFIMRNAGGYFGRTETGGAVSRLVAPLGRSVIP